MPSRRGQNRGINSKFGRDPFDQKKEIDRLAKSKCEPNKDEFDSELGVARMFLQQPGYHKQGADMMKRLLEKTNNPDLRQRAINAIQKYSRMKQFRRYF